MFVGALPSRSGSYQDTRVYPKVVISIITGEWMKHSGPLITVQSGHLFWCPRDGYHWKLHVV